MHARRSACRSCLQSLRSANLAAVDSHRRVVGHVLWLKRSDLEAPICQRPRHAGDDQRFADVGRRALEHDCAGGQRSELDAGLSFHAGGEMVLHERHLSHEIGRSDEFRLGVAPGSYDVKPGPASAQCGDDCM